MVYVSNNKAFLSRDLHLRRQSRDIHYYDLVICHTYTNLFAKSPSILIAFCLLIACLKVNVDLSLVSMQ